MVGETITNYGGQLFMRKTFVITLGLAVVYLMLSVTTMARIGDKKTIFTINQPTELSTEVK
jgi:hypothetical protein